jgi:hypothetical protein
MSDDQHIDKALQAKLNSRAEEGCVDTRKFESGTKLYVQTRNNVYEITFTDPKRGIVLVRNGTTYLEEVKRRFNGCTWGGTCLKIGHIGKGMHLEFQKFDTGDTRTTTSVESCQVVAPDESWGYELWEEEDEDTV